MKKCQAVLQCTVTSSTSPCTRMKITSPATIMWAYLISRKWLAKTWFSNMQYRNSIFKKAIPTSDIHMTSTCKEDAHMKTSSISQWSSIFKKGTQILPVSPIVLSCKLSLLTETKQKKFDELIRENRLVTGKWQQRLD